MTGRVVHFELPFDDAARAKAFYANAFGWSINDVPGMPYTLANTVEVDESMTPVAAGAINGGMTQRGGPITAPVLTIEVDDIDDALASVTKHGGSVVQDRQAVGDMGFTGYFADSEGNVVGLWQNAG
jgi:uncharacterized protein